MGIRLTAHTATTTTLHTHAHRMGTTARTGSMTVSSSASARGMAGVIAAGAGTTVLGAGVTAAITDAVTDTARIPVTAIAAVQRFVAEKASAADTPAELAATLAADMPLPVAENAASPVAHAASPVAHAASLAAVASTAA